MRFARQSRKSDAFAAVAEGEVAVEEAGGGFGEGASLGIP